MRKVSVIITSVCVCFLYLLTFFASDSFAYSMTEDFNDGILDNWVVVKDPNTTLCSAPWIINAGRLEISINQYSCTTNLMPNDELWNNLGDNYVIDFDSWFVQGTDHNVAFRFSLPAPNSRWYDFHFMSPNKIELERVPGDITTKKAIYPIPNSSTPYHFQIIVNRGNIRLRINNDEVINHVYNASTESFPTGRFAFRAGAGADPISKTYFDNLEVTPIDNRLDVPHFSQRDPDWEGFEYDHATTSAKVPDYIKIHDWGCALTSSAMVINYHGITKSPTGEDTNPQILNQYLQENHGYNKAGGVVWSAVTKYVREATQSGYLSEDTAPLEFTYPSYKQETVEQDFQDKLPDIVKIVMDDQGTPEWKDDNTHFVVTRGVEDGRIDINDPWDLEDTEATMAGKYAGKTLRQLGRFVPSHTDLSYIWLYDYNPLVDITVINEASSSGWVDENELEEIEGSMVFEEGKLTRPDDLGGGVSEVDGYRVLSIIKPEGGSYIVKYQAEETTTLDGEMFLFNQDADVEYLELNKEIQAGESLEYTIEFDKSSGQWTITEPDEPESPGCEGHGCGGCQDKHKWQWFWNWVPKPWNHWKVPANWWHFGWNWNHAKSGFWNVMNKPKW